MIASRIHQYLKSQRLMLIIVFGVVGVSILEVFLPPEPTLWVLFLPIIALSLFSSKPSLPIALAFVCTAILFFDHFVIERGEIWSVIFLKRSLGTVAFIALSLTINYALTIKLKQLDIQARLELSTIELSTEKLKLERSNRELEQFAGVAAHDLRSPIVTILSWLDILNLSIPNPKNQSASRALSIIEMDGLNLVRTVEPRSIKGFCDLLVPELQSRGAFKSKYAEGSIREKLFPGTNGRVPSNHPAAKHRAAA